MSNIIAGRQLRAARILAGLTQKQLAQAVGVNERAARYWELKENKLPTSTVDHSRKDRSRVARSWSNRIFHADCRGAACQ